MRNFISNSNDLSQSFSLYAEEDAHWNGYQVDRWMPRGRLVLLIPSPQHTACNKS